MELLMMLTYTALCIAVFKIFNIPLNKWTVPTAALGGILIIGAMVAFMNYNHPYSEICRSYFTTTPIVTQVKGLVTEVLVKPNSLVKKNDLLFRIDATPYQYEVDSLKARLVAANLHYRRTATLLSQKVGSQRDVDNALSKRDALKGQLDNAIFNLKNTESRAPTDGYVTQLTLRPGMMAVPFPLKPVMVFVHDEDSQYVAWFRQNSLLRLKEGDEAELALDALPGQVFKAKVKTVFPVIGEGQLQASGTLIKVASSSPPGRVPVILTVTDKEFLKYRQQIPGGAYGQAAIYTHHFHHVAVMRKILLRMASWLNYLFPFH